MKTTLLLALALFLTSLSTEAAPLLDTAAATSVTTSKLDATNDWGMFKRKKYKRKKRHNVNRSRYRQGGLFGR